jgi:hypothetical protein
MNLYLLGVLGIGVLAGAGWARGRAEAEDSPSIEGAHFVNWSNTHEVNPRRLYQPETIQEVEGIVAEAHTNGIDDFLSRRSSRKAVACSRR